MDEKLYKSLTKFYKAHQISKTKNLIDLYLGKQEYPQDNAYYPKCVWKHFDINGTPWPKQITGATSNSDTCFFVKKMVKDRFGSIADDFGNNCACCKCFKFFNDRYFMKSGDVSLASKKKKKS